MKKIYNFILTILAISSFSSCEHEWKDELYDHSISFAKTASLISVYAIMKMGK